MATIAQIYVLISQYALVSQHKTSPAHLMYGIVQHAAVACRATSWLLTCTVFKPGSQYDAMIVRTQLTQE